MVCIHDTQKLLKKTLKDILEADCVIIPIDLLESSGYLKNLDKMSSFNQKRSSSETKSSPGGTKDELPKLPSHDGTRERSGAKGVWLAATSNNPYGGGEEFVSLFLKCLCIEQFPLSQNIIDTSFFILH